MEMAQRKKGIIMVLTGAALWGASNTGLQYLFAQKNINAEWLAALRMLLTGLVFTTIALYQKAEIKRIWKEDLILFLKFSFLGVYLMQYPFYKAVSLSNAVTATVIQYLMPAILLVFYLHQEKRAPNKQELISVALAIGGTYLLVTKGSWTSLEISPEGLAWALASAFGMAFYTEFARRLLAKYPCSLVLGLGSLVACTLVIITTGLWSVPFTGVWDPETYLTLACVLIFGTFVAFYLYLESTRYIPASETGALAAFEPLTAFVLAVLVLHTSFGWAETVGALCIIAMVVLLARRN